MVLASRERLVMWVFQVFLVPRVLLVKLVSKVLKVLREKPALLVPMESLVSPE